MKEDVLINGLQNKDENTFKYFVSTYQDKIYNAILHITQSVEEAEDLSQEVFIEVYLSIKFFRKDSKLSTWLFRIAVNKALNYIRKQRTQKRLGALFSINYLDFTKILTDTSNPAKELEQKEDLLQFNKALEKLNSSQKTALVLHKLEDMSHQEISEIMGLSISAVESLIHRAKKSLQKLLTNR